MRAIILLTIFAVLPISCKFSVNPVIDVVKEAPVVAQKILDTLQLAAKTQDSKLFLSVFERRFSAVLCGHTYTYADLKEWGTSSNPVHTGVELKISNAVLVNEDTVKFEILEKVSTSEEKVTFTAIRELGGFKITTIEVEGAICSPRRLLMKDYDLQEEDLI